MKIAVFGAGYVGLVTGAGFAELGNEVRLFDIDKNKLEAVSNGKSLFYEPGLEPLLKKHAGKNLSTALRADDAVKSSDMVFICVGTPSKEDGSIDLKHVEAAAAEIGRLLKNAKDFKVIVIKSTVVPGTTENVQKILERESGKKASKDFGLAMNPEFLREGSAIEDFFKPDKIVIGAFDEKTYKTVASLYKDFKCPLIKTSTRAAEMIKYANNAMLSARISMVNELGNLCKKLGVDVEDVMAAVGLDKRIGPLFLRAGIGFGGSCFPKDVAALTALARTAGVEPKMLEATLKTNDAQPIKIVDILEAKLGAIKGKRVAVLGLAFKADTDDIRESRAIEVVRGLLKRGAKVVAYDPMAAANAKKAVPGLVLAGSTKVALEKAEGCLILAEWAEFKNLTSKDFAGMAPPRIIIEGRRVLDKKNVKDFEGVCW